MRELTIPSYSKSVKVRHWTKETTVCAAKIRPLKCSEKKLKIHTFKVYASETQPLQCNFPVVVIP